MRASPSEMPFAGGKSVAIVGSGPAALMAADTLSAAGAAVTIFEKRKATGRKLLVAGSSGLNVSNALPLAEFASYYSGPAELWRRVLEAFPPSAWIAFIEELGIGTFLGTSGRYFVEDMKASRFLQAWNARLAARGVRFAFGHELVDFAGGARGVELSFADGRRERFDSALLALGGGSWEPQEKPLRWPALLERHGLGFEPFRPSNVGYSVAWKEGFLKEAEGKPLKNVVFISSRGRRKGDAMVTAYGMEGTPVYFAGVRGRVSLDLKPDLEAEAIVAKLRQVRENLSPIRRVKRQLNLCDASFALLFHHSPRELLSSPGKPEFASLAAHIKSFPLEFGEPRSLDESISSAGGLRLDELDERFMLRRVPGVFAAGEMLDWDVPTGGFLIQGCVAQGVCAARGMLEWLGRA